VRSIAILLLSLLHCNRSGLATLGQEVTDQRFVLRQHALGQATFRDAEAKEASTSRPYSKTLFFVDRGRRWASLRSSPCARRLDQCAVPIQSRRFHSTCFNARDRLLQALMKAMECRRRNLTITPERLAVADFVDPWLKTSRNSRHRTSSPSRHDRGSRRARDPRTDSVVTPVICHFERSVREQGLKR